MSCQDQDAEIRFVLKRLRQEEGLAPQARTPSIPRSIVSTATTIDMSPFIRGFQDTMLNWVSSLTQQQDGCLQMVARLATQNRIRQEQLAQTVAHSAAMPSQHDQVQYLRAQLAHQKHNLNKSVQNETLTLFRKMKC